MRSRKNFSVTNILSSNTGTFQDLIKSRKILPQVYFARPYKKKPALLPAQKFTRWRSAKIL